MAAATIVHFLSEERTSPPRAFVEAALVRDAGVYDEAAADPEAFWAHQARELIPPGTTTSTRPSSGAAVRQVVRGVGR